MTSDDQKVVAGVFEMVDTHGVPLSFVLSGYQDRGLMPDWIAFYEKALKAGWKPQGIMSKLVAEEDEGLHPAPGQLPANEGRGSELPSDCVVGYAGVDHGQGP